MPGERAHNLNGRIHRPPQERDKEYIYTRDPRKMRREGLEDTSEAPPYTNHADIFSH